MMLPCDCRLGETILKQQIYDSNSDFTVDIGRACLGANERLLIVVAGADVSRRSPVNGAYRYAPHWPTPKHVINRSATMECPTLLLRRDS
jgi:hypothetical protein